MRPWEGGERGGHSTAVEDGRTGQKKERERKDNFFEFRTFGVIHMPVAFVLLLP